MRAKKTLTTRQTICLMLVACAAVTGLFLAQSIWMIGELDWIRTPTKLFDEGRAHHSLLWHLIGSVGAILFASRFWIQWWTAEIHGRSELGKGFWWASIAGSVISLVYFVHIRDNVNIFHYGFALVPYLRNLVLIRREQTAQG